MNINELFVLLIVYTSSLQYHLATNQEGVVTTNENIKIEVYENRLCFNKECYDIMNVNTAKRTYELKDGSRVVFRDKEIIHSTLKETTIYQDLKAEDKEKWQRKTN